MKFSSLLITVILFSLLSNIALGAITVDTYTPSKDFSLTSPSGSIEVCSCSYKYDSITVTNTGTWPAIFSIATNEIKSKLTLSQNNFELNPGESQEVFLYITADCSKGKEELKVTVTSNLGPKRQLIKEIVRDRCQNIEMWISNYTSEIKPCESKTLDLNIHNIGPFSENYKITSNYDRYLTYNTDSFKLESNQYAKITVTAKFDCSIYGQKNIVFTVQSQSNNLKASTNAPINIIQDYDYEFTIAGEQGDSDIPVCNRVHSKLIPVYVKNTGSVTNTYNVDFSRLPKKVQVKELSENQFTLNPEESKTFYIDVSSTHFRNQHKTKDITISISPTYGDISKKSKISLEYLACYEHVVVIYDGGTSKRNSLKTCADYDYSYDVEIINKGSFTETYTLELEGEPEGTILSRDTVQIRPGRDTVKLYIIGPNVNGTHNIQVTAKLENGISETANTWIKTYDTQSCHATEFGENEYRINYQTNNIAVPVTNKGLVDNAFIVSWEGSDIVDFNDKILNLQKKTTQDIILPIYSTEKDEGVFTGTLILQDASQATYSKNIQITLKDKSFFTKAFEYLAFNSKCTQISLIELIIILILIVLIIAFLVQGPHYPYNFKNRFLSKMSVLIFLVVLFLIGLVLVVLIAGLPKTQTEVYNLTISDSELTYEWLENDKFQLDASKFFYDPENSTLRYDVIGLEHITTESNGNIITFYPERDWNGTEQGRITAIDKMGGNVTSPRFTFTVVDVPEKTKLELYTIYCWYVNLAIYTIILVLIFVAVFVKQKRRSRK